MRVSNCPSCGAPFTDIDEKTNLKFCPHCGVSLDAFDERKLYQVRDEAKIREAEAREKIRLKELEAEATEREEKKKSSAGKTIVEVIVVIIFLAVAAYFYFIEKDNEWSNNIAAYCGIMAMFFLIDISGIAKRK